MTMYIIHFHFFQFLSHHGSLTQLIWIVTLRRLVKLTITQHRLTNSVVEFIKTSCGLLIHIIIIIIIRT